jgi:PAS domain S-box-containing protein
MNLQPTETTDNFWGFAIVVIDLDVLLAESYISDDHEYNIALRGKDLDGKKGEILFGNQELFDDSIDIRIIDFPGGSWELAVDEKDDNPHKFMPYWNIWLWTIGLILVSLSTYMFISIFNRNKEHAESESIATELRQFIETANAPIFGIDSKGLINEWNQTAEKITGFKKADVLGEDLVKGYITEDYQAAVKEVLDKALVGKETANYEFPLFTKDGYRLMVLLNSSTRRDSEGKITGVLGVGQDISEMDKLKEELEYKVESRTQELSESLEREKELGLLKSRFVAMASHEFRTPLTTINATSDIILKYANKMDQDEINLRLEIIKDEVKGMTVMLEDVLIIGKSDVQKLEYNPESVDVISLIKDIIAGYQLSDSENRTFIYHLSSTVIMAKIDKKWIKNIIINLVSNAVKYSDQDTDIEVSINRDQDNISFSFKDYGIGISKEDIKLLFEPFYRGSNVNEVSGSGLGLAVLQKAVNLHKGKIEIESEIGKGSIFTVTLPIV